MKRHIPLLIVQLVLVCVLAAGCDRGDNAQTQQPATGGGATTQAGGGATVGVPQVGIPVGTAETYKPVVGKYGGRLIRNHLSEPKSFNPIVASETSTTDYTNRMFEGLTTANVFTGETEPQLAESWEVA